MELQSQLDESTLEVLTLYKTTDATITRLFDSLQLLSMIEYISWLTHLLASAYT